MPFGIWTKGKDGHRLRRVVLCRMENRPIIGDAGVRRELESCQRPVDYAHQFRGVDDDGGRILRELIS